MYSNLLLLGSLTVAMMAAVIWCWRGKTPAARRWGDSPYLPALILAALPALSIMCFGGILRILGAPDWVRDVFIWAGIAVLLYAMVVLVLSVFWRKAQRWWGPKWYAHHWEN